MTYWPTGWLNEWMPEWMNKWLTVWRMDGQTDWQTNRLIKLTDWLNLQTDGRTDGRTADGLTDGRTDGPTDGLMDGRTKKLTDWLNLLTDRPTDRLIQLIDGLTDRQTKITQINLLRQLRKLLWHPLKKQQREAKLTTTKSVKTIFPSPTRVSDTLHMQSMLICSSSLGVKTLVASSTLS